jgi:misacylated tRNA(Ala) deacylase
MTDFLYQKDSYLREFESDVMEVDENYRGILLATSAFYPGGGGQPADTGMLYDAQNKSYHLTAFNKTDGKIWHILDGELPLKGSRVKGVIDWDRRYSLMRTHTAMHILCGVIWRDYKAQVTGSNMEPLAGRMDFEFEFMKAELVKEIEEKVNEEIKLSRSIEVRILPRTEAEKIPDLIRTKINLLPAGLNEIRIVNIVGLDLQADGGTHVFNTREVGRINIYDYQSKGRINKRVKINIVDPQENLQDQLFVNKVV